jgi:hypothetical protein
VIELQKAPRPEAQSDHAADLRRHSIAHFEQVLASGDLPQARTLLEIHIAEFPADDVTHLEHQLSASRAHETQKQTALIEAARQVNDPDRVLELFRALEPNLELEPRQVLERDLARWFLSLVHRRLRSGKIQPDVVTLAQKVADHFGSTVEGASLRAALPTMRRSVGLCPRCAQPYLGSADACPKCAGGTAPTASTAADPEADLDDPDVDDADLDDSDLDPFDLDDADLAHLQIVDPELDSGDDEGSSRAREHTN